MLRTCLKIRSLNSCNRYGVYILAFYRGKEFLEGMQPLCGFSAILKQALNVSESGIQAVENPVSLIVKRCLDLPHCFEDTPR
jgi:hypothetical protein